MLHDLFINAGMHTVPLKGKLERLETGKKTIPIFEEDWRAKYTETFHKKAVPLAGVITGACSGIIAIDCDNQATYDIFKSFDPTYKFHFVSEGKPEGGGTIIYKYTDEVGTFKLANDDMKLDFYADEGFVYLPTEANKTKQSWANMTMLPPMKEAPEVIKILLKTFAAKAPKVGVASDTSVRTAISNRLAPMIEDFCTKGEYSPALFKILTPKSFRDLPTYVKQGHLHPDEIPEGRGSEYLSKVSAILGSDISVSAELYTKTIGLINSFWKAPMDRGQLLKTVINPMLNEQATIDGDVIWKYDEHWEDMGFIATASNGDYIESFFDDVKSLYYLINYTVPYIKTFTDKRPLLTTLKTLLARNVTEGQYDACKQINRTVLSPALEFGHVEASDEFNLFRQTEGLTILNDPEPYKHHYNRPTHILNYFESLIPDDYMRGYVLSFLRTKLTTFKYSPVVLYLIGKPGSGKDTMVGILRRIIGDAYVAKPDTKVFLEQYNGWMMDKYIIQLDEYGNKLVKTSDKQEALGKIKAYTGSEEVQIRAMRQDGFNYMHSSTFIMTANSNPLPVETDDRRIAFVQTPNKLEAQPWVREAGGISHVIEMIQGETLDFCYYLANEVENLNMDEYVIAPETEDKEKLILSHLPAVEQIIFYVNNSRYKELCLLADEYGVGDFKLNWDKNKLLHEKLMELYDLMTEGAGTSRTLIRMMKDIGMKRSHTTFMGSNCFYYYIPDLHNFASIETKNDGFVPMKEETVKPKGL